MSGQEALADFTLSASAAAWTFFALAAVAFILRTISRIWYIEMPFGWEDCIITTSWLLDVVRMVTFALALSAVREVAPANEMETVPRATFWALFTDSWAFLSVTLPKIAVAFLLIRLFRPRPWIQSAFLGLSIGLFIICIVGFIICFVQCSPVAGQWDPYTHPDTKCWPRDVQIDYSLVGSSTSTALDLLFAVYPAFVIARLKMKLWKKISTISLMGLGLAAFATGVVKVSQNGTLLGNPDLIDLYVHTMSIGLWNSIENDIIIIAACVPLIPAIFNNKRRGSSKGTLENTAGENPRHFAPLPSSGSYKAHAETDAVELMRHGQAPGWTREGIHVQYDITVQQEQLEPGM